MNRLDAITKRFVKKTLERSYDTSMDMLKVAEMMIWQEF